MVDTLREISFDTHQNKLGRAACEADSGGYETRADPSRPAVPPWHDSPTSANPPARGATIDRARLETQLLAVIENAGIKGRSRVERLRIAHTLMLPNLDPDEGKLQFPVVRTRRSPLIAGAFHMPAPASAADRFGGCAAFPI